MLTRLVLFVLALGLFAATPAKAHFGVVHPSKSTVLEKKDAAITVTASFLHPFEQKGMHLDVESFKVYADGKASDLTASLKEARVLGKRAFDLNYTLAKPGLYTFALTPKPYWEPAEECFIIHYTKSIVAAFGEEEGWNEPLGLPVEIVPLTRPFASYPGVFRGRVLKEGKPQAHASVEVEYLNGSAGTYEAPNAYSVTQVVVTDDQGIFCANVPFAGWWGFAALVEGDRPIMHEGKERRVELGGVLWTEIVSPRQAK